MFPRISEIITPLEEFAPLSFAESYDNCGLIVGNSMDICTGVLITLDVNPAVVEEAYQKDCNLIIAHHPIIFKGIKKLSGNSIVEKTVVSAIRKRIAIYACHTNLDKTPKGVSYKIAQLLGVENIKPLLPESAYVKLNVYVPTEHAVKFRQSLFDVGAGEIKSTLDSYSFNLEGQTTYRTLSETNPFLREFEGFHKTNETKIELLVPTWLKSRVEKFIHLNHPSQEPVYEFINIESSQKMGLGAIGNLLCATKPLEFISTVKSALEARVARTSQFSNERRIRKIAMCGGSGSSLIETAIAMDADAFVTADLKYHEFIDYGSKILLIDIGHHESENCAKRIFYEIITKKFSKFAVHYSENDINPIKYI